MKKNESDLPQEESIPRHRLFRGLLEIEFEELDKYLRTSLLALKRNEEEWEQKYQTLKESLHSDDELSAELPLNTGLHISPFLLKHALFTSVYSFMEYALKKFSAIAASDQQRFLRRLSGLEKVYQFYAFLSNEMELDTRHTEDDWKKLNIFKDIRNSIVHYNSTLGKNISNRSYEFIRKDERIHLEEPNVFRIKDDALIIELMEVSKRFLFRLIDEYDQRYFKQ